MRSSRTVYSDSGSSGTGRGGGGFFGVMLAAALIVLAYFAGAGVLGSFVADNIITPAVAFVTGGSHDHGDIGPAVPEDTATPMPSQASEKADEVVTRRVSIAEDTVYTVQGGVYSDRTNAFTYAKTLKHQGAGGYIQEDGGYRVLLSAYKTEADAKKVAQRLSSENNIDAVVYTFRRPAAAYDVTASESAISAIESALAGVPEYLGRLYDMSAAIDDGSMQPAEAAAAAVELRAGLASARDALDGIADGAGAFADGLFSIYIAACESMDALAAEGESVAGAASALKYALLEGWSKWSAL